MDISEKSSDSTYSHPHNETRAHRANDILGVLFDFDGVLVDSVAVHRDSWIAAFRTVLGRETPEYTQDEIAGRSTNDIAAILARKAGVPGKAGELARAKVDVVVSGTSLPELLPGAAEVTGALRRREIPFGIVSNAPSGYVGRVSRAHGLYPDFAFGFEDVVRAKPDPAAYTTGASHLGFRPEEYRSLLVCEDSETGLKAAIAAGMQTLALTTSLPESVLRDNGTHFIASNLLEARNWIQAFN